MIFFVSYGDIKESNHLVYHCDTNGAYNYCKTMVCHVSLSSFLSNSNSGCVSRLLWGMIFTESDW